MTFLWAVKNNGSGSCCTEVSGTFHLNLEISYTCLLPILNIAFHCFAILMFMHSDFFPVKNIIAILIEIALAIVPLFSDANF